MPSEQFFCCYNRSAIFFLCMCLANIYVIVIFFFGRGGRGVQIGSRCGSL